MDAISQIQLLIAKIEQQSVAIRDLQSIVAQQAKRIVSLEEELAVYKNKKNSGNSHLPPSKDENRPAKNQSLRTKSTNKPGGQPGHEGSTLQCASIPDEVIKHSPEYCSRCGQNLCFVPEELIESRQVIDLPVIRPVCIEHRSYRKVCTCGHCTESNFPDGIHANLQYGAGVQATAAYLHARQMIPYQRMQEFFSHVLNLPVSAGTIYNMLQKIGQKATPLYAQIKERISRATTVGTDETGARVGGKKSWMWTWQNESLTFIAHADNRAYPTIQKHFPKGFPNAVLQHDRYAAHFNCEAASHQICTAHLLRDLQYINELYADCLWSRQLQLLLFQSIALKRILTPTDYYTNQPERTNLQIQLNKLLEQPSNPLHRKAATLQKSLRKHRDALLTFLYHPKVPPDNNGSERAIRNIKIKQKVSGQFKSENGATTFAILRSVIDTTIKNKNEVLDTLRIIAKLKAE